MGVASLCFRDAHAQVTYAEETSFGLALLTRTDDGRCGEGIIMEPRSGIVRQHVHFDLETEDLTEFSRSLWVTAKEGDQNYVVRWDAARGGILTRIPANVEGEIRDLKKVYRMGVLSGASSSRVDARHEAFLQELRALGYVEGKNILSV